MSIPSLKGYEIVRPIREAATSISWEARQLSLDRTVCLKVLRPDIAATDPKGVQAFLEAARVVAGLKHPGIVQVYDTGVEDGVYFVAMEHVDGPTVMDLIARDGALPEPRALAIVHHVSLALDHAWRHAHVIHRNITPQKIVINEAGEALIADLGLPNPLRNDRETPRVIQGTPNYMSPEQAEGDEIFDCRSDIYALGATLYHMLTGTMPFADRDALEAIHGQINDFLTNPRTLNHQITAGTANLIRLMMMKDALRRPQDWLEVSRRIKTVKAGRRFVLEGVADDDSTVQPFARAQVNVSRIRAPRLHAVQVPPDREGTARAFLRVAKIVALLLLWWRFAVRLLQAP